MNKQDGTQSSTKQRRSRKINTVNQQNDIKALAGQFPTNDNSEAWKAYWKEQGQPWRTEPEIGFERQQYLANRVSKVSDKRNDQEEILYFKDIQLSRADMEWLLAMHKQNDKIVFYHNNDETRFREESLNLSGADLRRVNLAGLPMEKVNLWGAHMEGASLRAAHLEGALLNQAHLEGAILDFANLQNTYLTEAQMVEASIVKAHLEKAMLSGAHLEGADLQMSHLEEAYLVQAHLEGADIRGAHLEGAMLVKAHLERADIEYAHFEGADLKEAHLEGVRCCRTFFDVATRLNDISLSDEQNGSASIGDVSWNGVNLTVMDWSSVKMLGYEHQALQRKTSDGEIKTSKRRLSEYKQAVRANRQLAVVLRDQGMNEEADHFSYRAQILQRTIWRLQRRSVKYIFSWFLDLLSGYGYKPIRSIVAYIIVTIGFAIAYYAFGHIPPLEAFVFSLTSFHGRGFFPGGNITLSDLRVVLAAFEAVIGLLIEISFIATFTQRFFGR